MPSFWDQELIILRRQQLNGAPPNTQVSPITLGTPGHSSLQNEQKAIEHAIRMGLASATSEIERS